MSRRGAAEAILVLALDPEAVTPLYRQVYDQTRAAILAGRLQSAMRLPSSRSLAEALGCSRNTIVTAFEQLLSEGYLEGHRGSGTYVSSVLPEQFLTAPGSPGPKRPAIQNARSKPSKRGQALAGLLGDMPRGARGLSRAFALGPDTRHFPFDVWGRLLGRIWRRPGAELLSRGDAGGYPPLRQAVAAYLRASRALNCDWRQVLITSGAQQALDLIARVLLDPGNQVWIEDPGYPGLRGPLLATGQTMAPVPVDAEGLSVAAGQRLAPGAKLAIVTPSHQYPLGITMSLARRLELIAWAQDTGAWILEDDYDSEYRYGGRPLAALQSLDRGDQGDGRVIYVGTFSKVMFQSLRLGYLVVPENLVDVMIRSRAAIDDHPSAVVQPALAAFIEEGHFAAHIRRMRGLYAQRQAFLLEQAAEHLADVLVLNPDDAGLHLVAGLRPGLASRMSDREASKRAAEAGITAPPLSAHALAVPKAQGLMLGYAAVPEIEIKAGVLGLARALA